MKRIICLIISLLLILVFSSCSKENDEFKNVNISSIRVVFDYDEKTGNYNSNHYTLSVVRSGNTSIKDHCTISYYVERSAYWTEDPDGTKHIHSTGGDYQTTEYDISVFNDILKTIKQSNPIIYSGPQSDSTKQLIYSTLPYMIILSGSNQNGIGETIYINEIDNFSKMLETIEDLKK